MKLSNSIISNVSKRMLLLEAALVWTLAGVMLLFRGSLILIASSGFSWINILACTLSGLIFFVLMFSRISLAHINRITHLSENHHWFYEFFNRRSYLMMLSMISLGVLLRRASILPSTYLSLAYITMGIPLLLSSFRFYHRWYYYISVVDGMIA
jgi:hypothetical protein